MMDWQVRVISQQPPGGRCRLYTGYADVLASRLKIGTELVFSSERGAHGSGFPSLLLNGEALQPEDGAILMPADLCAALAAAGVDEATLAGLAEALEGPLEAVMDGS